MAAESSRLLRVLPLQRMKRLIKMRNSGGTAEFFALSKQLRAIFYHADKKEKYMKELPKTYEPKDVEARLYQFWSDNGGYMNTGYQLSYSTPKGAKSATSHVGRAQYGKSFFQKDMPQLMAATGIPYVATVAESQPLDFIRKAAKAKAYAAEYGTAYLKALSACPLNWGDAPNTERQVIAAAVDAGITGWEMCKSGRNFHAGDGLVGEDVEKTITNIGRLARLGMRETDEEILRIMTDAPAVERTPTST